MFETYLLVLAALFPIVNPPGAALVFLTLTKGTPTPARRELARRVAINAFFVMATSLMIGALILRIYGISVPVLRVAGGFIVATAGWRLLNEGSDKAEANAFAAAQPMDSNDAFYPLTLPITTGPGTIAVLISLGLSRAAYTQQQAWSFFVGGLLATATIAIAIYVCFFFADRVEKMLGKSITDIAVRLSALILFCLGVQIMWTGISDLLLSIQMR